jgi:hypothetical protein
MVAVRLLARIALVFVALASGGGAPALGRSVASITAAPLTAARSASVPGQLRPAQVASAPTLRVAHAARVAPQWLPTSLRYLDHRSLLL